MNVEASWCGKYSEKRSVTKWRKVSKNVGSGRIVQVDEPYTDTETIWHPINGNKTFSTSLLIPAAAGFSKQQLAACSVAGVQIGDRQGYPEADDEFAVASQSKTEMDAWIQFGCENTIDSEATRRCDGCAERVDDVSAVVTSKEFSLVFYPVAMVSYSANNQEYRNFVNLITGGFSGDLPLDEESIRKEMATAAGAQMTLNKIRTAVFSLTLVVASLIVVRLWWEGPTGWLLAVDMVLSLCLIWTRNYSPWGRFIWSRRGHLLRMFLSPPDDFKATVDGMQGMKSFREVIQKRSAENSLETMTANAAKILGVHVATLLRAIKPDLRPDWHWALKYMVPAALSLLAGTLEAWRLDGVSKTTTWANEEEGEFRPISYPTGNSRTAIGKVDSAKVPPQAALGSNEPDPTSQEVYKVYPTMKPASPPGGPAMAKQDEDNTSPPTVSRLADGGDIFAEPQKTPEPTAKYPTLAAFLAATRSGESPAAMNPYAQDQDVYMEFVFKSLPAILLNDYKISKDNWEKLGNNSQLDCGDLFRKVTAYESKGGVNDEKDAESFQNKHTDLSRQCSDTNPAFKIDPKFMNALDSVIKEYIQALRQSDFIKQEVAKHRPILTSYELWEAAKGVEVGLAIIADGQRVLDHDDAVNRESGTTNLANRHDAGERVVAGKQQVEREFDKYRKLGGIATKPEQVHAGPSPTPPSH